MSRSPRTPRPSSTRRAAAIGTGLLVLAVPGGAQAASSPGTMAVSASVVSSAAVTATALGFGAYAPSGSTASTTTSTVAVTATNGTPYTIGIDAGTGTGATVAARKLTSGTNILNYSVYTDAAHATVWGAATVTGTGSGLAQSYTAYGQIPAGQNVASGLYTDTLTVTVTY